MPTNERLRIADSLAGVSAAQWNSLAGGNPFLRHEFLGALIDTGCASARTGWQPQFLLLERDGHLAGAMPLFVKSHSRGEYVFDWAWADAYARHGVQYYPKLLGAVPFTPVVGPRLLAADAAARGALAAAALAAARHAGVRPEEGVEALAAYQGVRRRMQLRGSASGVEVYDDFAHHPTAIRVTLEGLRQRDPGARILAVFEPRSNTMKAGAMKDALPGSFAAADQVYVYTSALAWDAAAVFAPLGARAHCLSDIDALVATIAAEARQGDRVLVMSNGAFGGIHEKLLARLGERAHTPG